jgi:hypothetical protein
MATIAVLNGACCSQVSKTKCGSTDMAEAYFYDRARDCRQLASEERDRLLSEMLLDLEQDYLSMARRATAARGDH